MTVGTDDPFLAMNRGLIGLGVYMDRPNLPRGELQGEIGPAVARQTLLFASGLRRWASSQSRASIPKDKTNK